MLNRDQLQELGRFKLLMRKMHNTSVQVERFLTDLEYQSQMLDIAEEFDDNDIENDELIMLSLVLRSKFGRLGNGDEAYATIVPVVATTPEVPVTTPAQATTTANAGSASSVSLLRSLGNSIGSSLSTAITAATTSAAPAPATKTPDGAEPPRYIATLR